ncbi:cache domain-containing sensor histidine kinase [Paenibacillus thalictri]|uniref:histidine kinase n=1 Tax=Paenibacillus thalictri TaxID=2527873 RepID=A0A4Q9E1W0_9BACL|nr:sensor histidine kinase [Paenibacillus thalictri]TBL81571.1 sensor histidine kinase [Paenibacillus thalictri]
MRRGIHSIHNRLFVLFLVSMLSLLLIVSALYYKRTTDQFHDKIGEIAQKNFSQTMVLFDLLLKGYDSLTKSLNGNPDLQRLLAEPAKDPALKMINERTITNMIGAIYYSREDLIGIHVIALSGTIYSYGNMMTVIDPGYAQSDWYDRISRSTGEMIWLGAHPKSLLDQQEARPVFAFGRLLYDLHEHKPIGLVLIETDPKPILSGLSNLSLGPHSEVAVLSKEGTVVASALPSPVHIMAHKSEFPAAADGQVEVAPRSGHLMVSSKPTMADWQVVSMTPDSDLNVELDAMKHFLLVVGSVLVVVSTLLATFVSRTISSPLKRLIHQMRQVEKGNFHGVLKVKSYEEINFLVASFNHMVSRMDELIERVKAVSASEKHAQLQALQSQVNPHFLYNTLDMIYWMLDERENERLCKVVLSLSHMFHYSSRWDGNSEVTLGEELEQIGHYLTIIDTRLDGRLAIELDVPQQWHLIRLPKMTLQPIIENAVKYGLEPLSRPGRLRVYTTPVQGRLQLCISDDGAGIEPVTLEAITRELEKDDTDSGETGAKQTETRIDRIGPQERQTWLETAAAGSSQRAGIGIGNVHRRLRLMFGEEYGLKVRSSVGKGTIVVIPLPITDSKGEG